MEERIQFLENLIFKGKLPKYVKDSLQKSNAFIYTQNILGEKQEIPVHDYTRIKDIKEDIVCLTNIPFEKILLKFGTISLKDEEKTLLDFNIPSESTLYLVTKV